MGTPSEDLLQEAQQEIAAVRGELYATRRTGRETQQSLIQISGERDALTSRITQLETSVHSQQQTATQLSLSETRNSELQASRAALEGEIMQLRAARDAAAAEAAAEAALRRRADDGKARAEAERSRLQRARDQLVTALRECEHRAQEAEDDQMRAEQMLSSITAELRALQRASLGGGGIGGGGGGDAASREAADEQVAAFMYELETERTRTGGMAAALKAAKAAAAVEFEQLQVAREHIAQLTKELSAAKSWRATQQHLASSAAENGPAIAVQPLTALSRPQSGISLGSSLEATHHSDQDSGLSTDLIKPTLGEGSVADYSIGASAEATEQLRGRIKSLLASRDKLLAEVDAQSVEIERLGNENLALSMGLEDSRETASRWETQAQQGLAQAERLKDLLQESAEWCLPQLDHQPGTESDSRGGSGGEITLKTALQEQEQRLLAEQAQVAALDAQVRALCMELARSEEATSDLGRAILPALSTVEGHLAHVLRLKPTKLPGAGSN